MGSSTGVLHLLPNIYTRRFRARRLSTYSLPVISAIVDTSFLFCSVIFSGYIAKLLCTSLSAKGGGLAGLPQYTSNLRANLNYFFAFQKKEKTRKKRKKPPGTSAPPCGCSGRFFKKWKRGKENIGLALAN